MKRASFGHMECGIARAVDAVGDAWTLLLLREAFLGATTFAEFQSRLPVAPNTLSRRLVELTRKGLFTRTAYQRRPAREEYVLTEKAMELLPVLLALGAWGNRWLAPRGAFMTFVNPKTKRAIEPRIIDARSKKALRPGAVALTAGPGASRALRRQLREPVVLGTSGNSRRNSP
ncbi:MAG: helix-turn-helix domain-containing protein [Archangium sp.]